MRRKAHQLALNEWCANVKWHFHFRVSFSLCHTFDSFLLFRKQKFQLKMMECVHFLQIAIKMPKVCVFFSLHFTSRMQLVVFKLLFHFICKIQVLRH